MSWLFLYFLVGGVCTGTRMLAGWDPRRFLFEGAEESFEWWYGAIIAALSIATWPLWTISKAIRALK